MRHVVSGFVLVLCTVATASMVGLGCNPPPVDSFICPGVSSSNPDMAIIATAITIRSPSLLGTGKKFDTAFPKLDNRMSMSASYGGIFIELLDIYYGRGTFNIQFKVTNTGTESSSLRIPTDEMMLSPYEFMENDAKKSDGDRAEVSASTIWIQGGPERTEGQAWGPGESYSLLIKGGEGNLDSLIEKSNSTEIYGKPFEELFVEVDFDVPRFRSAKLQIPLKDLEKDMQTKIVFDLEYLLSYDQMWH